MILCFIFPGIFLFNSTVVKPRNDFIAPEVLTLLKLMLVLYLISFFYSYFLEVSRIILHFLVATRICLNFLVLSRIFSHLLVSNLFQSMVKYKHKVNIYVLEN